MSEEFIFSKTKTITIKNITKIMFSKDGQYMITGSNDNLIQIFDINTGTLIHSLPPTEPQYSVRAIAISPDEQRIAFSSSNSVVRIWDRATNTYIHTLTGQNGISSSLIFTPDGQTIISSSTTNEQIIFWNVNTGDKLFILGQGHFNGIQALALSSDGLKLASAGGSRDSILRIWNVNKKLIFKTIQQPTDVSCFAFSPDNQIIVCGYTSQQFLRIFDVNTGQNINKSNKSFKTNIVTFSPNGLYIVAGDFENSNIYLFDVGSGENIMTLLGHTDRVTMIMFDLTGDKLMTFSSSSQKVIIYEKIVNAVVEPTAAAYNPPDVGFYVGEPVHGNIPGAYASDDYVPHANLTPVLKSRTEFGGKYKSRRNKRNKRNKKSKRNKRTKKSKKIKKGKK